MSRRPVRTICELWLLTGARLWGAGVLTARASGDVSGNRENLLPRRVHPMIGLLPPAPTDSSLRT